MDYSALHSPSQPPMPRKFPRQQRSQRMVNAILDGCHKLLLEHGEEALTVAVLEALSGVTKGSIYQYFPNLEAVVGALFEREFQGVVARSNEYLQKNAAQLPLEQLLQYLIDAALEWHSIMRGLHQTYYYQYCLYFDTGHHFNQLFEGEDFAREFMVTPTLNYLDGDMIADPLQTSHLLLQLLTSLFHTALRFYPQRINCPDFHRQTIQTCLSFIDNEKRVTVQTLLHSADTDD